MNDIPCAPLPLPLPLPLPPPPSSSIPCPPSPSPSNQFPFSFLTQNALPPFAPSHRSRPLAFTDTVASTRLTTDTTSHSRLVDTIPSTRLVDTTSTRPADTITSTRLTDTTSNSRLAFTDTVASILQRRRTSQRSFHHVEMDDDEEVDVDAGIAIPISTSTCTSTSTSPRTRMATPQPLNTDEDDLVFELEGWENGTTPTSHMEERPENPMSRYLIQRERRVRVHRSRGVDGEPASPVWASSPALIHASPLRAPRHPSLYTHRPRLDSLSEQPSSPSISSSIPSSPTMGSTSIPIACQHPSSTTTFTSSSSSLPPPASPLILASPPRLPKHQHQLRPPATAISLWSHITPLELDGDVSPISTTTSITTPSPFTTTSTTTPSPFPAQSPIPMPSPFPSTLLDPLRKDMRIRTPYSSRILHFNPKCNVDMSDITSSIPVQPSALSHLLSHHIRDKEEMTRQPIASMGE